MSIVGISNFSSAPSVSSAAPSSAASATTESVSIPGSPFAQQVRTTPDSLVVQPQMPPLLFSAVGSLVDETA